MLLPPMMITPKPPYLNSSAPGAQHASDRSDVRVAPGVWQCWSALTWLALLLIVLGASVVVVRAPLQTREQWSADQIAPLIRSGVYETEQDGAGVAFRWTDGDAALSVPVAQSTASLELHLHQPNPAASAARVRLGQQISLALPTRPTDRHYVLFVPDRAIHARKLQLDLASATFEPLGEARQLGLALVQLGIDQAPNRSWLLSAQLLSLGLALGLLIGLMLRLCWTGSAALALVALCTVAFLLFGHATDQIAQRQQAIRYTLASSAALAPTLLLPSRLGARERLGLGGSVGLGAVIVALFWHQLFLPLWIDEQWRAYYTLWRPDWWAQLRANVDGPIAAGWLAFEMALVGVLGQAEWVLRLPMALSIVGLHVSLYRLSRRWFGVLPALLVPTTLLLTGVMIDYGVQIKPYVFEAMCTVLVVLLWLRLEQERNSAGRWVIGAIIGMCCICSTPTIFVLGPLIVLRCLHTLRSRTIHWRHVVDQLGPLALGGALAAVHLVWFVMPQAELSNSNYWNDQFVPRTGWAAAIAFVRAQLAGYVPTLLTGPGYATFLAPWLIRLVSIIMIGALVLSGVAAWQDRATRAVWVAVGGALALQFVASALRLWPFGNVRVNLFLTPLIWLLFAIGLGWPYRLLNARSERSDRRRPLIRWSLVAGATVLSLVSLWLTGGQAWWLYQHQGGVRFGDGMYALVAEQRAVATPHDLTVVVHPQAWKGWIYYSSTGDGDLSRPVRERLIIAPAFDTIDLQALAARFPDAPHLWVMALEGTSLDAFGAQTAQLEQQGYVVREAQSIAFTGKLWQITRPTP